MGPSLVKLWSLLHSSGPAPPPMGPTPSCLFWEPLLFQEKYHFLDLPLTHTTLSPVPTPTRTPTPSCLTDLNSPAPLGKSWPQGPLPALGKPLPRVRVTSFLRLPGQHPLLRSCPCPSHDPCPLPPSHAEGAARPRSLCLRPRHLQQPVAATPPPPLLPSLRLSITHGPYCFPSPMAPTQPPGHPQTACSLCTQAGALVAQADQHGPTMLPSDSLQEPAAPDP